MCLELADQVHACDAGDLEACLALSDLVGDHPPHMMVGSTFFMQACRIGDPSSCERFDAIHKTSIPCEQDVLACQYRAFRTSDAALHREACALGGGESCAMAASSARDSVDALDLLETGCALGNPLACWALGIALDANCPAHEYEICLPPDPAAAQIALEMACDAGFGFPGGPCPESGS